jgi:hypothetical protein
MKKILWFLLGCTVAFLLITWLSYGKAEAVETCPNTGGWIKVEPLSGKTYTYSPAPNCTVSDNCYKHSTFVHYGTGVTVTADSHCTDWEWWGCSRWTQYDLSHASFKVNCVAPTLTPTNTPVPTATCTPIPTATSTPEPTATPVEPTETPMPTPIEVEPTKEPEITEAPKKEECKDVGYGYNGSPNTDNRVEYNSPVCTVEVPKGAVNPQYNRNGNSVKITWDHDGTNLTKWSINYGTDKDNMPYGVPYLPKEAREITLNGLTWNGTTWVAVCGYNTDQCQSCIRFDP